MPTSRFSTNSILSGFCLILPPLVVVSPHAVVPLLIVAALLAGFCTWRETGRLPRPDRTAALLLGLLLLWAAITATLEPVIAAVVAYIWWQEVFTFIGYVGGGLILFSVVLIIWDGMRRERKQTAAARPAD